MTQTHRTVSPHSNVPMSEEVRKQYPKDYFSKNKSHRGEGLKRLQREGKVGPRGGVRYQKKLKPFRIDKKNPRNVKVTTEIDQGESLQVTTITTPTVEEETRIIPKNKKSTLVTVWQYDALKIKRDEWTGKYYFYVGHFPHDKFICEIHLGAVYDLADILFHSIGAITRTIVKAGDGQVR